MTSTDRLGRGLGRARFLWLIGLLVLTGCQMVPSQGRDSVRWSVERVEERLAEVFPDRDPSEVTVVRTDHYIVFSSAHGARSIGGVLEDVHRRFLQLFPIPLGSGRLLPVYLFASREEYQSFYTRHAGVSEEVAQLSVGHAWQDYLATFLPLEQESVLLHEGVHQLMLVRAGFTGGGSWYHEGLAEYFERTYRPAGFDALVRFELRSGRGHTLEELIRQPQLLDPTWGHQSSARAIRLYALAASFIEFLHRGPYRRHFAEFLKAIGQGPPFDPGFVAREVRSIYGISLGDLDQEWRRYWLDGEREPVVPETTPWIDGVEIGGE
ncbi:MAG: hypothetical protein RL885_11955 [Planctomycetota bacterium]